jgi:adenylate cyclase
MKTPKVWIPISGKLIFITMLILLSTVIPTMKKALEIFEKTARRTNEELNLNIAMQKSEQIHTIIMNYIDKARTLGTFMLSERNKKLQFENFRSEGVSLESSSTFQNEIAMASQAVQSVFQIDQDIMAIELYENKNEAPAFIAREAKEERWKALGIESGFLDKLNGLAPLPLVKILQNQFLITSLVHDLPTLAQGLPAAENRSLSKDIHTVQLLKILVLGAPLATLDNGEVSLFVVAYIHLDRLQNYFKEQGRRTSFVTDDFGNLIVHANAKYTDLKTDFRGHEVIKKAIIDQSQKKQLKYQHPENKEYYLSAFVKDPLGMIFVSEVSEKSVVMPVLIVKRQAIYVAGFMLSVVIFIVFLFSTQFTGPIEKLVEIAQQIAKGDFNIQAKKQVRAYDELGTLANAFDEMAGGLKERDKVKMLFNKFHGSSIAEEMLTGEITMRGSNRNVVVFFSDVRGFTAFSEGHTPEEVVDMLNEYFAIMVSIINKNFGIVDKFIGDAIMAVWGAPTSTGKDCYWCIKACLEMREALEKLNAQRLQRGHSPLMIGMGVHFGPAISGTIGSQERMEYTVIGDTVNQTSRIESSTKAFGTDLLVSHEVSQNIDTEFWVEYAGAAEVKGKAEALKLFTIRGRIQEGIKIEVKTPYSAYAPEKVDKVKLVS